MSSPTGSLRSPRSGPRRSARKSRGSARISAIAVFYYDPFAAPAETVARIDAIVGEIQRDPKAAAQQALAARAIFDEKFAGEVMLGNAVRYFSEWRERAGRTRDPADGPLIDVVIRAGHSPIGNVYRALRSIDGQTAGRFRVILVCCNGLDASGLTGARWNRIDSFETVNLAADDAGMALALGLKAVRSDLFAILEEDDFWLCGHIESLLALAETAPPGRAYAYSGVLRTEAPAPGDNAAAERRRIASLAPLGGDIEQIAGALVPGSFLASSALLRFVDLDNLAAGNAGAVVLQAHLVSRAEPAFSQRATLCVAARGGGSAEAGLDSLLRLHALADRLERQLPSPAVPIWSRLQQAMQRVVEAQRLALSGKAGVLALEGGTIVTSIDARDDLEREPVTLVAERIGLEGRSRLVEDQGRVAVAVRPPESAWAYGVRINLDEAELLQGPQWVVVEFPPVAEAFGIGLLDRADDFLARMQVPVSAVPVEAWLHLPDRRWSAR